MTTVHSLCLCMCKLPQSLTTAVVWSSWAQVTEYRRSKFQRRLAFNEQRCIHYRRNIQSWLKHSPWFQWSNVKIHKSAMTWNNLHSAMQLLSIYPNDGKRPLVYTANVPVTVQFFQHLPHHNSVHLVYRVSDSVKLPGITPTESQKFFHILSSKANSATFPYRGLSVSRGNVF